MENPDLIPLTRPDTDEREVDAVASVLASGILTQGPKVAELEERMAALVGTEHAIATTSATTALHLTLAGLAIGHGDDVLVADFTFPATANVVIQQGARPILVDVDPTTLSMDPADLENRVTPASRAIIPVHPFGLAADMDGIRAVADRHGLLVVEDAATALGAMHRDRPVGGLGVAGCFSFHPRKSITTGEGGMIVTNDHDLADRMRLLRSHGGRREHGRFTFEAAGYNYRLSDVLAAIGIAQLEKLDGLLTRRRSRADRYRVLLSGAHDLELPTDAPWGKHVFQSYVVLLPATVDRDAVIGRLANAAVESTIGTYALHSQPFYMETFGYRPDDLPRAESAFRRTLSIPLFPSMTDEQQDYVADQLMSAVSVG
jgi:dTDP-4-amino-4,6-dideoxygalactose transaminase